jgi:hypothetical protein
MEFDCGIGECIRIGSSITIEVFEVANGEVALAIHGISDGDIKFELDDSYPGPDGSSPNLELAMC